MTGDRPFPIRLKQPQAIFLGGKFVNSLPSLHHCGLGETIRVQMQIKKMRARMQTVLGSHKPHDIMFM